MTRISHTDCPHPATPRDRATCRTGRTLAATTETVTLSTGAVVAVRPADTTETVTLSTGAVVVSRSIATQLTEDLWVVMERQHANTERMSGRTITPSWVRAGYATAADYVAADPALAANQAARVAARNA